MPSFIASIKIRAALFLPHAPAGPCGRGASDGVWGSKAVGLWLSYDVLGIRHQVRQARHATLHPTRRPEHWAGARPEEDDSAAAACVRESADGAAVRAGVPLFPLQIVELNTSMYATISNFSESMLNLSICKS